MSIPDLKTIDVLHKRIKNLDNSILRRNEGLRFILGKFSCRLKGWWQPNGYKYALHCKNTDGNKAGVYFSRFNTELSYSQLIGDDLEIFVNELEKVCN